MAAPHDLFKQILAKTGDRIAALRAIREKFGLNFLQAKEVMIQAEGIANSLGEHQARLADSLEAALSEKHEAEELG